MEKNESTFLNQFSYSTVSPGGFIMGVKGLSASSDIHLPTYLPSIVLVLLEDIQWPKILFLHINIKRNAFFELIFLVIQRPWCFV